MKEEEPETLSPASSASFYFTLSKAGVLNWGDCTPQGTFGSIWRCFYCHNGEGVTGALAYDTETNPGTQELRPPSPESTGQGWRVTRKRSLPQSFTASPDAERSVLEFVTELSDNQNFNHKHTFLCVHNQCLYA